MTEENEVIDELYPELESAIVTKLNDAKPGKAKDYWMKVQHFYGEVGEKPRSELSGAQNGWLTKIVAQLQEDGFL